MFLESLAEILEIEGVGTVGTDIFVYAAPADTQVYALLMMGGDGLPYDNELPGFYNTRFQVIVRHYDYELGFQLANDIKEALNFYGRTQSGIIFKHSLPKDEPRPFRRNEAGIIEFSNNFFVSFVKE